MTNSQAIEVIHSALIVAIKLSAPILLISMAIGVVISILQAATQIHEQTVTFVPKLAIIALICLMSGNWMLQTMQDLANQLFTLMLG